LIVILDLHKEGLPVSAIAERTTATLPTSTRKENTRVRRYLADWVHRDVRSEDR
jgi:hypothetical protein